MGEENSISCFQIKALNDVALDKTMKDNTVKAFFALIRANLWEHRNQEIRIDGSTDWNEIYQLAQEQSVLGLALAGLEHSDIKPPKELLLQWIGEVQVIEQRNKEMNVFIAEQIDKLRKAEVDAVLVKGQGVAQCYERPLWRSCGDVDLFLNDENYQKAKELLLPLGKMIEPEEVAKKHFAMGIDGWAVELHGSLKSGLSSRVEMELDGVQVDTFNGGQVRSWMNGQTQVFLLKAENDAFYVFTHILQHFYKGGIGLRQICDWSRLLYTYKGSINRDLLEQRITRAGLMTEWKAFGALVIEYLGMPVEAMPFYSDSIKWKRKASRIMEFVMMSGNFGHNRDSSYMKYPYLMRKLVSMGRRIGDLFRHARIFPLDSIMFSFAIMVNGVRSAIRGE